MTPAFDVYEEGESLCWKENEPIPRFHVSIQESLLIVYALMMKSSHNTFKRENIVGVQKFWLFSSSKMLLVAGSAVSMKISQIESNREEKSRESDEILFRLYSCQYFSNGTWALLKRSIQKRETTWSDKKWTIVVIKKKQMASVRGIYFIFWQNLDNWS